MVELHVAGCSPIVDRTLEALFQAGVNPAQRGEFTLRAFLAGRLDLVQAEAVLAVIDSEDSMHLRRALKQLAGGMSDRLGAVQSTLVDLLADLEAGLDFVEEDIEFVTSGQLLERLDAAESVVKNLAEQTRSRIDVTTTNRVVLAGLPNVGKSTLFNRLTGADGALVSNIPGTTRDYLSATVHWDGVTIELIDTAGWESTDFEIMHIAQDLRSDQIRDARLIVWCTSRLQTDQEVSIDRRLLAETVRSGIPVLPVLTRSDQAAEASLPHRDSRLPGQRCNGNRTGLASVRGLSTAFRRVVWRWRTRGFDRGALSEFIENCSRFDRRRSAWSHRRDWR